MMISEGKGMHADSIAIAKTTPQYPQDEMREMTKKAISEKIFEIILNNLA